MSDYMAAQMDAQIDGAICENERLAAEVDRLTAEADALRRERDELSTQVHIITSERDELADCVQSLRAKHTELAARMEAIERTEPADGCGACGGSGWVTRDPDIGTDQECPACSDRVSCPRGEQ